MEDNKSQTSAANSQIRTYRCNDCGNPIYRHEVFCSKCGKKLDHFDFSN